MTDKLQKFRETLSHSPPEALLLIRSLFQKYSLPIPVISVFNEEERSEVDIRFIIQWIYPNQVYAEFTWSGTGYSWYGYIGDDFYGSQKDSNDPIPPESDQFIRKIFPQTPEEINSAIFDQEVLARVVQYYSWCGISAASSALS